MRNILNVVYIILLKGATIVYNILNPELYSQNPKSYVLLEFFNTWLL